MRRDVTNNHRLISVIRTSLNSGPLHTYKDIFFKKTRIHTLRIGTVLARLYENTSQWKYDSIPYGACVMLVLNDS